MENNRGRGRGREKKWEGVGVVSIALQSMVFCTTNKIFSVFVLQKKNRQKRNIEANTDPSANDSMRVTPNGQTIPLRVFLTTASNILVYLSIGGGGVTKQEILNFPFKREHIMILELGEDVLPILLKEFVVVGEMMAFLQQICRVFKRVK